MNGFGHDASVIDIGLPDINLVMKIDRAAKPIAALNGWSDYRVWGRLAVTANCSDILATGGRPTAFMLSVSVTGDTSAEIVREIVSGASEECAARNVAFLGGDTKEAASTNIVGAALGTIPKARHFDRRRGKVGDLLILAGELGGFLGGYWNCQTAISPPADAVEYLAHPRASWREADALAVPAGVRSACDLSDGLASSAMNLAEAGAGVLLEFSSLPFHPLALSSAVTRDVDILPYAFGVGDWGILYAVDPAMRPSVDALRAHGLSVAIVGAIVAEDGLFFVAAIPSVSRHRK